MAKVVKKVVNPKIIVQEYSDEYYQFTTIDNVQEAVIILVSNKEFTNLFARMQQLLGIA